MNAKQEKKLRKLARRGQGLIMNNLALQADDLLAGIKAKWSLEERQQLCNWLMDDTAGDWKGVQTTDA